MDDMTAEQDSRPTEEQELTGIFPCDIRRSRLTGIPCRILKEFTVLRAKAADNTDKALNLARIVNKA